MRNFLILVFVFAFATSYAKENQSTIDGNLDDVEVLGSRFDNIQLLKSNNSTFITSQEIADSGVNSVPEILSQKTSVRALTYSGNPNDANLSMRGFSENCQLRVAIIVDGVRYNRVDMANIPWLTIPMGNIENIELLRGAICA